MRYDPLGRLYKTTGALTTRFLYDGDELISEYDGAGTILRRYVHGPGNDDPLVWFEGSGVTTDVTRHIRTNHQGSVVSIADNAGANFAINSYDEWGIPSGIVANATPNTGRFQYTGQAWIPELGMYHYKARIYSPSLGRFLQTDPIGYDDQVNLYAYVGNDPVNMSDPSGTEGLPLCPSNDPTCTNPGVTAPLTEAERKEQDRINGREMPSGSLPGIVGSEIANSIDDALVEIAPIDTLDNLTTSAAIGAAGEAAVAQEITSQGWIVVGSHVTIQTAAGVRVADHVVSDGQGGYVLIEVKANSATRSFSQARKDHIIGEHGGISRSRNSVIPYGSTIRAPTARL